MCLLQLMTQSTLEIPSPCQGVLEDGKQLDKGVEHAGNWLLSRRNEESKTAPYVPGEYKTVHGLTGLEDCKVSFRTTTNARSRTPGTSYYPPEINAPRDSASYAIQLS